MIVTTYRHQLLASSMLTAAMLMRRPTRQEIARSEGRETVDEVVVRATRA